MRNKVLVLRPEPQNRQCQELLQAKGVATCGQALIGFEAGAELNQLVLQLREHQSAQQAIVAVSPRAVVFAQEYLKAKGLRWPKQAHYYAVGNATAEEFKRLGLNCISAKSADSEGLLLQLNLHQSALEKVLILRAQNGRESLASWLKERQITSTYLCCYTRKPLTLNENIVKQWSTQVTVILATSGQIVQLLSDIAKELGHKTWLLNCPIIVPSIRVAELAQRLGYYQVVVASDASDEAMLQALQSLPLLSRKHDER